MTQLKLRHEQLVQEALQSGRYRDTDEFLDEALSAWKQLECRRYDLKKAQAAAATIRELRKGVTLGEGSRLRTWWPKAVGERVCPR